MDEYYGTNQNGAEIEHYGRLGMKWGQHIFGEEKTYRKAMTKISKADAKATLKSERSAKHKTKGDWRMTQAQLARSEGRQRNRLKKANRQYRRAHRSMRSSVRNQRRARRIVKAMNKEFANKTISSITSDDVALGKKYSIDVINRSLSSMRISDYEREDD